MKTSFLLICALTCVLPGDQGGQSACKFRGLLKLINQSGQVQCRCLRLRLRRPGTAEIRIRVEGTLKFLSVDLSILVQNMCIYLRDHIDLGVSGIALRCFQVTMVELQFVSRAGNTTLGNPAFFFKMENSFSMILVSQGRPLGSATTRSKSWYSSPRNSFSSFCAFLQSRRI